MRRIRRHWQLLKHRHVSLDDGFQLDTVMSLPSPGGFVNRAWMSRSDRVPPSSCSVCLTGFICNCDPAYIASYFAVSYCSFPSWLGALFPSTRAQTITQCIWTKLLLSHVGACGELGHQELLNPHKSIHKMFFQVIRLDLGQRHSNISKCVMIWFLQHVFIFQMNLRKDFV